MNESNSEALDAVLVEIELHDYAWNLLHRLHDGTWMVICERVNDERAVVGQGTTSLNAAISALEKVRERQS